MKLGPSALFFRDLYGKTLVSESQYFSHVLEGKHCAQDKTKKKNNKQYWVFTIIYLKLSLD